MKLSKNIKLKKDKLYYLACPYTALHSKTKSDRLKVQNSRFKEISKIAIRLIREQELNLLLPITTSHILQRLDPELGTKWETWQKTDENMIRHSDAIIVATMPGWEESVGVQAEIKFAKKLKKPIYFVDTWTLATWKL